MPSTTGTKDNGQNIPPLSDEEKLRRLKEAEEKLEKIHVKEPPAK